MVEVSIPEMMEAGAHFGHQTKRWNPKMRPYIYGVRSGVHILDLQKTKDLANEALAVVRDAVGRGASVLFVGTKPQARQVVQDKAVLAKQHFVNQRWMGGTLTNFKTIKNSIDRLIDLETRRVNNDFQGFNKRELLEVDRTIEKLTASLGGIKSMVKVPEVIFVVDPKHEHIAVQEARKMGSIIVALVDSNCDPDPVDHVIPANDDAMASVEYMVGKFAEACLEGLELYEQKARQQDQDKEKQQLEKKAPRRRRVVQGEEGSDKNDDQLQNNLRPF